MEKNSVWFSIIINVVVSFFSPFIYLLIVILVGLVLGLPYEDVRILENIFED